MRELIVKGWSQTLTLLGNKPKRLGRVWFIVNPLRDRKVKQHRPAQRTTRRK